MISNHFLSRQLMRVVYSLHAALVIASAALWSASATAAEPVVRDASSTINYAFATELGSGVYDLGGQSLQVFRVAPEWELREASEERTGLRLVLPITAGFFGFTPGDAIGGDLPSRIDSFSLMPGFEFDRHLPNDWIATPWVRAGASFAQGHGDGWLFGAGMRFTREWERDGWEFRRQHELTLALVNYRTTGQSDDKFLRLRQALDLRRESWRLGPQRRLLAGFYGIVDIVPDPPDIPAEAGRQGTVQLELGVTLHTRPAPFIGRVRIPRVGFGYRAAADFSGWRIVIAAPF